MDTPKLLIVDDALVIRDALYRWFSAKGFETHTAEDGLEGVALARAHRFAAIVMDLEMPRMNGRRAIEDIRVFDPGVPIVILTGYSEEADGASGFGVARVLKKPIRMSELEDEIRATMRS